MTTCTRDPPRLRPRLALAIGCIAALAVQPASASAAIIAFPLAGEPGGNFSSFNDGGVYSLATGDAGLRISKPADDGSFNPSGFVEAGLLSNFTLSGDFTVTVDFTLYDLPFPAGQEQFNESLMAVVANDGSSFEDLRFAMGAGRNLVEAFDSPFTNLPTFNSDLTTGVYQISRVGSTISGAIAASESSPFISLGSASGFTEPMHVQLYAAQGENSGSRSTTAIDVGFSGLTIEADGFNGVVPEPASVMLWAGVMAVAMMRAGLVGIGRSNSF